MVIRSNIFERLKRTSEVYIYDARNFHKNALR